MNVKQSVRPSPVFLVLVAVTVAGAVCAWLGGDSTESLARGGVFVFVFAGWIVSLCLHEFGHAYTAWRFGDTRARGYLTLNPLQYTDPVLSIALPLVFIALGGIGLPGGAVYVHTAGMTNRQRTIVSLAGPTANAILAVLILGTTALFADREHVVFWAAMAYLGFLQVTAVVLNLLPVPGLDGYGALEPHLSPNTQRTLGNAKTFGFLILFALLMSPPINRAFFGAVYWIVAYLGVDPALAQIGGWLFRFWSKLL
ncbi:Zn-dependent proteases [Mycobacteroides abscessus subsp. abscessus]|uniref:site-2 protease family protein n=1 Tax=Mycobacteroides abscessus TaxID=36809 RepID=UPI0009A72DF7|nr:site-2 protease family protein [Mycobacteroides abscessus]SLE91595.1 Zn-dependent proteases [Mycobacteroides abscessus subsp. abscessus]